MTTPAITGEVISAPLPEPWSRRDTEGVEAYEAFSIYRNMPLGARSMTSVAIELGKSTTLIYRWASEHEWVARSREFDRYLDRARAAEAEKVYRDMGARQGRQAAALADMLMRPAYALIERITRDPDKFKSEIEAMTIDEAYDLATKAARVWPQVMKAERLAHGLSTENVASEIDGAIDHVIRIEEGSDPVAYLRALAELASNGGDSNAADE